MAGVAAGITAGLPTCPDKTRPVAWVYKVEAITGRYDGYYLKTADLWHRDWFHVANMTTSKRRAYTTTKIYGTAWGAKFFTRRFEVIYV